MGLLSFLFGKKKTEPDVRRSEDLDRILDNVKPREDRPKPAPSAGTDTPFIKYRKGAFPMEVVGESNYQAAFVSVCGEPNRNGYDEEFHASIRLEPENEYDPNAVMVDIYGQKVGYLPRAQAARVGAQMRQAGIKEAYCRANVRGGWKRSRSDQGAFGVWLAIPPRADLEFVDWTKHDF